MFRRIATFSVEFCGFVDFSLSAPAQKRVIGEFTATVSVIVKEAIAFVYSAGLNPVFHGEFEPIAQSVTAIGTTFAEALESIFDAEAVNVIFHGSFIFKINGVHISLDESRLTKSITVKPVSRRDCKEKGQSQNHAKNCKKGREKSCATDQ